MGFGNMFDKLDDIVYEPVKLVCDALRRPLDMLDKRNQKKMMEFEQQLQQTAAEFDLKLEIERDNSKVDTEARRKRLAAELAEWQKQEELNRQIETAETIKRLSIEMGKAAAEIPANIGKMSIENRDRAYKMVQDRTKDYMSMQSEIRRQILDFQKEVNEMYEKDDPMRIEALKTSNVQLLEMGNTAKSFLATINDDLKQLQANIDSIAKESANTVNTYLRGFSVGNALIDKDDTNKTAISSNNKNLIEHDETIQ